MPAPANNDEKEQVMELKEGDVFRWRWKDEVANGYHCKSQITIVENGRLRDTFWTHGDRHIVDPGRASLKYIGNLNDFSLAGYRAVSHYDRADVLDLRHPNAPSHPQLAPVYIRKGAAKSTAAMMVHLQDKLREAQREHRWAFTSVEQARQQIERLQSGDIEGVYL